MRISWKHMTEVGRFIKGDSIEKAENKLERVIKKELPVPMTKFNSDAGHKPGNGPGRYPEKAAEKMLELVQEAAANADNQGLNKSGLKVENVIVNQGPKLRTPKRHRGRTLKSAHTTVVVEEK